MRNSFEPVFLISIALSALSALLIACGKNDYKTTAVGGQARASSQVEKQISQIRFTCPSGNCEPFASTALVMIKNEQTNEDGPAPKASNDQTPAQNSPRAEANPQPDSYSTCTGALAHNNTVVYTSSQCLPKAVLENPERCSEFVAFAFPGISGGQGVVRGCTRLISATQGTKASSTDAAASENSGLLPKHTVYIAALKIEPIERRTNNLPWSADKAAEDASKVTIQFPVLNATTNVATFQSVKCTVRNRSALAPTFDLPRAALQAAVADGQSRPCDVEHAGLHGAPVFIESGNQISQHWVALTQGQTDLGQLKRTIHPKFKFLRRGTEIQSDSEIPRHVRFANVTCYTSYDPEPKLTDYYCDRPHWNLSGPSQQFPMRSIYSERLQPHELTDFLNTHIPQTDRDQKLKSVEQELNNANRDFFLGSAQLSGLNVILRPTCVAPAFLGQLDLKNRTAVSPSRAAVRHLLIGIEVDESLVPTSARLIDGETHRLHYTLEAPIGTEITKRNSLRPLVTQDVLQSLNTAWTPTALETASDLPVCK